MKVPLARAALGAALLIGATASMSNADSVLNAKHFLWAPGQDPAGTANSLQNDVIYHGGSAGPGAIGIQKTPAVYLIYWGTEWASGFTTPDTDGTLYSSRTLQNYLNTFMANLGGSPWAAVQTQYCRNVPAGTTSCAGIVGADYITNPKHQLKGYWTDPTPVPDDIVTLGLAENLVDDPLATEAQRAAGHFGWDPNATYVILTPPRPLATGQPVTAATTRRPRASMGSATRSGSSTRSSRGRTPTGPGSGSRAGCTT